MSARTTIVTVAYNSEAVIGRMLASVPEGTPVVVVDNASTDDLAGVLDAFPAAKLLPNGQNHGFGRACNLGADGATTEFLLFLNPDAELQPGAVQALESFADATPDMGAANPLILNEAGKGRVKMSSVLPKPNLPRPKLTEAGEMPVLSGGAFFVRRAIFEAVGRFDPQIFLYHEDHELSRRIAEAGHSLWHVPEAKVMHAAGTGTARSTASAAWKGFQMARSRVYVIDKANGRGGFARTFWPALLGLLGPTNFLSARRRAKYLGQLKGAWSARRDGGRYNPQ